MRARRLHWAAHKRSARAIARALLHHPQMMATSSYAFRRWKYRRAKPLTPTISAARKRSPYGAVLPVSGKTMGCALVVVVVVVPLAVAPVVVPVVVVPVVVIPAVVVLVDVRLDVACLFVVCLVVVWLVVV